MNKKTSLQERESGEKVRAGFFEIEREGRRVLRRLTDAHLFLAPEAQAQYALAGSRRAGRILRVSAVMVAAFRERGWIEPRATAPETFALSKAGAAWLATSGAPDPFAAPKPLLAERSRMTPEGLRTVTVNEIESPLARLRIHGHITPAQFEAGERLRQDFTLAGLMPRLCADLTAPIANTAHGAKAPTMTEALVAARQRFRRAMASVGPDLSDLLFDVCCHLKGLESVEARYQWPTRSAKVVLQIALDRLAAHYGIATRTGKPRTRVWHADVSASA
ncbi:MAG TPA: DUF6456 domain-containing protein [Rhizomicrobium sp.]|nr:DUF6456 domain-containing protein [Rhizomicrobium sp.]